MIGDARRLWRSATLVLSGAAAVVLLAAFLAWILPELQPLTSNGQITGRTAPSLIDLITAVATGFITAVATGFAASVGLAATEMPGQPDDGGNRRAGNPAARAPLTDRVPCRSSYDLEAVKRRRPMSVYNVIEIIGTSSTSWEEAAAEAVRTASQTIRDVRVAEVVEQDVHLDEGGAITYRTKLQISFKYAPGQ